MTVTKAIILLWSSRDELWKQKKLSKEIIRKLSRRLDRETLPSSCRRPDALRNGIFGPRCSRCQSMSMSRSWSRACAPTNCLAAPPDLPKFTRAILLLFGRYRPVLMWVKSNSADGCEERRTRIERAPVPFLLYPLCGTRLTLLTV